MLLDALFSVYDKPHAACMPPILTSFLLKVAANPRCFSTLKLHTLHLPDLSTGFEDLFVDFACGFACSFVFGFACGFFAI